MFEEEKEIQLHDYKKIRYMVSYIKNIIYYSNKKVYIPILEIWGSNQCNLRCKECINRIPFFYQKNMVTDTVINSIQRLSEIAKLNKIVISGGEPFLNDELYKIISCVNVLEDVKKIYIVTNGTLMPDKNVLSILSAITKPIKVIVNEYGVTNRIEEIKIELKKRGIPYTIRRLGKYQWNGIGNDIYQPLHFETGRMVYADCRMKTYAALHGNIITKCPRGILGRQKLEREDLAIEHLKVSELKNNILSRAKLATCLDEGIHKEYCRMCFGVSNENPYLDEPGIQINDDSKGGI